MFFECGFQGLYDVYDFEFDIQPCDTADIAVVRWCPFRSHGDGVVDEVGDGDDDGTDDDEDGDGDVILLVAVVKYELQSTTHFASALRPCYSYLQSSI